MVLGDDVMLTRDLEVGETLHVGNGRVWVEPTPERHAEMARAIETLEAMEALTTCGECGATVTGWGRDALPRRYPADVTPPGYLEFDPGPRYWVPCGHLL